MNGSKSVDCVLWLFERDRSKLSEWITTQQPY